MKDYLLHTLSPGAFEELVVKICHEVLGLGTISFSSGKDGGRDAFFEGIAQRFPSGVDRWAGGFVIQAKHTEKADASCSDSDFARVLRKEAPKVAALRQAGRCDNYLLFTNRKLSALKEAELVEDLRKKAGVTNVAIVGKETLTSYLDAAPEIAERLWRQVVPVLTELPHAEGSRVRITRIGVGIATSVCIIYFLYFGFYVQGFRAPLITQEREAMHDSAAEDGPTPKAKCKRVVELYEDADEEGSAEAASELFKKTILAGSDEWLGYIAASYTCIHDHRSAAILTIERDRRREPWDHELKRELAYSIRNYAIRQLGESGSYGPARDLVTTLRRDHPSKLISYFWIVLPTEIVESIGAGVHREDTLKGLSGSRDWNSAMRFIREYHDDSFLDHGYYFVGESERALSIVPESRMADVLTYASAVNLKNDVMSAMNQSHVETLVSVEGQPDMAEKLKGSKRHFESYLRIYHETERGKDIALPHGGDAKYWLAWIEASLGNLRGSLDHIKEIKRYGFGDFVGKAADLRARIVGRMLNHSSGGGQKYFDILSNEDPHAVLYIAWREFRKKNFQKSKMLLDLAKRIDPKSIGDVDWEEQLLLVLETRSKRTLKAYERAGSRLRWKHDDREMAVFMISEGLDIFAQKQSKLQYLRYLQIIAYREYQPSEIKHMVEKYLELYPEGKYADDVLAELGYVQLMVFGDLVSGEETVRGLLRDYRGRNACDNALSWLAYYSLKKCKNHEKEKDCERARMVYEEVRESYPRSRFARYAKENIAFVNDIIASDTGEGVE